MRFFCVLGDGLTDSEGEPVAGYAWQDGEEAPVVDNQTLLCSWDGQSDSVEVISGAVPEGGVPFAGWPKVTT